MSKITDLLQYSLDSGASDLHLSVGSIPMVRINGIMNKLQMPPLDLPTMKSIKDEILDENQKNIFNEKLEIDFSYKIESQGRFRVNIFHQIKQVECRLYN